MKSAIAILTYRRLPVLQETLKGINQFCAHYPLAVFEDCGQRDGTSAFLTANRRLENRPIYAAAKAAALLPGEHQPGRGRDFQPRPQVVPGRD